MTDQLDRLLDEYRDAVRGENRAQGDRSSHTDRTRQARAAIHAYFDRRKSGEGGEDAIALIAAERRRQIESEGWAPEHDDEHTGSEMIQAASCYVWAGRQLSILPSERMDLRHAVANGDNGSEAWPVPKWPWHLHWWKPGTDPVRALTKAGALIAAEIDRLQRDAARTEGKGNG